MADMWIMFDEYVTWYLWARTGLVRDSTVCHTAAAAAVHVLSVGGGHDAAAAAARNAASDETAISRTRRSLGYRHLYVEWFIWARVNRRLCEERCHEVARSALQRCPPDPAGRVESYPSPDRDVAL
jgi:hypothetical protein